MNARPMSVMLKPYTAAATWALSPLRMYSPRSAVGNGRNATVSSSTRLRNNRGRSTVVMRSKMSWWLTQMMPMMTKLTTYAAYEGHWFARSRASSPASESGTRTSMMSSVMAIAKTPSLNASSRVFGILES